MSVRQKLKSKRGFSLAETMMAVLILLLVSAIVATGIPAARNVYERAVVAANAQVLLSTTANALRDELGTAWDVKKETDNETNRQTVSYFSTNTGARSRISKDANGVIMLEEYVDVGTLIVNSSDASGTRRAQRPLVTGSTASDKLLVTYDSVEVKNNTVVFENLKAGRDLENPMITVERLTIPVFTTAPVTD